MYSWKASWAYWSKKDLYHAKHYGLHGFDNQSKVVKATPFNAKRWYYFTPWNGIPNL